MSRRGWVIRLFTLILGVASTTALAISSEQRAGTEPAEFRIVSGDGYEGAIVPPSSPWHGLFRVAITRERGRDADVPPGLTPWTPEPADIAVTERHFSGFVERLAKAPAQVLAALPAQDRRAVEDGLPWLVANVRTLKHQDWASRPATFGGLPSTALQTIRLTAGATRGAPSWTADAGTSGSISISPSSALSGHLRREWVAVDRSHVQVEIRATVAPVPYVDSLRRQEHVNGPVGARCCARPPVEFGV